MTDDVSHEARLNVPWYLGALGEFLPQAGIAADNWLFETFESRRRSHHLSFFARYGASLRFHAAPCITLALGIGFLVAGITRSPLVTLVVFLATVAVRAYRRFRRIRRRESTELPASISELCFGDTIYRQALTDLYMANVTGRVAAEAFALECVSMGKNVMRITFPLLCAAFWGLLMFLTGLRNYESLFVTMAFLFFIFEFRFVIQLILLRHICRTLQTRFDQWEKRIFESIWRPFGAISFMFAAALLLSICLLLFLARTHSWSIVLTYWFVLNGLIIYLVKDYFFQAYSSVLRNLLDRSNQAFSIYMTTTILDDDLGRAWSTWYYGSGRAEAAYIQPVVLSQFPSDDELNPKPAPQYEQLTVPLPPPVD